LGSAKSAPKTVLRLGYGIFYDRFTQDLVLQAQRTNGVTEQLFVVAYPTGYPANPCVIGNCNSLTGSSPTIYQINPNLRAPYTMQAAVSVERQLGNVGTLSVTYLNSRGIHQLDLLNANAPDASGVRPLTQYGIDNVYQYNSEAIFKQNQVITNAQIRLSQKLSVMGFYAFGYANSDTAGPSSNPSNSFRLTDDYGRASFDVRHRIFLSGTASLTHNIRISPFVIAHSGAPFNITTGSDLNGDSFFTDRPAFASSCSAAGAVSTQYGCFNVAPAASDKRIPINYGKGPANLSVNLRISKTFGFGEDMKKPSASAPDQGGGPRGGGRGGPGGGFARPRGMGGLFGPSNTSRR
jgi:hypothetical protein